MMLSREYLEEKIKILNKEIKNYARANSRNPYNYAKEYPAHLARLVKAYESQLEQAKPANYGTKWTSRAGIPKWDL